MGFKMGTFAWVLLSSSICKLVHEGGTDLPTPYIRYRGASCLILLIRV